MAHAQEFYVDPVNGSADGDGSAGNPWRTLQQVVNDDLIETRQWDSLPYDSGDKLKTVNQGAPVEAGDTIWLRDGYHGKVKIRGAYNEEYITIAAEPGQSPRLARLVFKAASYWKVRGVSVSPSYGASYSTAPIVEIDDHSFHGPTDHIVVDDAEIFSTRDVSQWDASDWVNRAATGVIVDADHVKIMNSRLKNVRGGISVYGDNATVVSNEIVNFSRDGLRGNGDFGVFEYNVVKNSYDVDDNHDDGFQSFSTGSDGVGSGEVRGVVLRGNVIINYEDPDQPMRSTLQGIGAFDGMYIGWVVENNVVVTDHYHGITFSGARGVRIVNNTVIDPNGQRPGPAWIRVTPHKDGRESKNVLVRNNLVSSLAIESGDGVTVDHNVEVALSDYASVFMAPEKSDYRLAERSVAVDAGVDDQAPLDDLGGVSRPQGVSVDAGAYERVVDGSPQAPRLRAVE